MKVHSFNVEMKWKVQHLCNIVYNFILNLICTFHPKERIFRERGKELNNVIQKLHTLNILGSEKCNYFMY